MTKVQWRNTTVHEFVQSGEAELKTGPFGTQLHARDYVEHGTPVINVRNIGFGSVIPEKLEFLDDETVSRLEGHLLQRSDIVFGRKGAVERHVFIRDEQHGWFQGSDCLRLRIRSAAINPLFLSYLFLTGSHKQWMINQCSHGATMASLNQAIICRIPFRIPDIDTQNRITQVLAAYDDLIENNTRRIKILEQMAQMLYREWFVNFRFPGHEKLKIVDSGMGPVPESWTVVTLGDVASVITKGTTPTTLGKSFVDDGVGFVKVECVSDSGLILREKLAKIDLETHELLKRSQLQRGDILFSIAGAIGRVALVPTRILPANTNQALAIIRCSEPSRIPYLLQVVRSPEFLHFSNGHVVQTAQANVSLSVLKAAPVLWPESNLLVRFTRQIQLIQDQIECLAAKSENLRKTRDMLLPKLVSGEISIDQKAKAVAKAL